MHLNYNHLRCFAAVVEEGGVVPAAERLGVSHPTISEQLKKLEDQLELSLFDRRGRRLRLTEDGEFIYGYASQIFGIGDALLDAAESRTSGRSVIARVGIDQVLPKLTVRKVLGPMFEGLGDSLRLRCVEREREHLLSSLRARQLDLVLTDSPAYYTGDEGLTSHELESSQIAFFAARSLELTGEFPKCLNGAPFLLPMPSTRLRRELERWMGEHRISPKIAAEVEDSGLMKVFGEEGRGVFAVAQELGEEIERLYDVRLVGVAEDVRVRVFAIVRQGPVTNAGVGAFLEAHGVR